MATVKQKLAAALECLEQFCEQEPLVQGVPLADADPRVTEQIRERVLYELSVLIRRFLAENYRASTLRVRTGVLWEASVTQVKVRYDQKLNCIVVLPGDVDYPRHPGRVLININVKRWGAVYRSGLGKVTKVLAKGSLFKNLRRRKPGKPQSVPVPGGGYAVPPFPPFWQFTGPQLTELARCQQRVYKQELKARTLLSVADYSRPITLRVVG